MGEFIGLVAVTMIFGIPLLAIWTKHQKELMRHEKDASGGQSLHLARQVEALEERVQVLERIITDRGYDVATQIEALRDMRRVDDMLASKDRAGAKQ